MNYALIGDVTSSKEFTSLQTKVRETTKTRESLSKDMTVFNKGLGNTHDEVLQKISTDHYDGEKPMLCKIAFNLKSRVASIHGTINCPWIPIETVPTEEILAELKKIEVPLKIVDLSNDKEIWSSIN